MARDDGASGLAASSGSWSRIAPMPLSSGLGPAVGVVTDSHGNSIAYVLGGTDGEGGSGVGTRAYDVATNTWLPISSSENRVFAFNTNGVGNIGGKLYFSGGEDYGGGEATITSQAWMYDPVTNTLTQKADMPLHTAEGVSGVIGDKLYVLPGACSGDGWPFPGYCSHEAMRKLFRYNPATNTWINSKAAPHYHRSGVGDVLNGKFYVAGGLDDRFAPTRDLDVYDPATNSWKTLAPLPQALSGVVGAAIQGQLSVIGRNPSGTIRHYAYSPANNKWSTRTPPSTYRGPAAKVFLNGAPRLLVLLGATADNREDGSQIYTP